MTSLRIALFTLLALLHVSVAQEPSLQVLPSNIMKALGDGVYVSCEAHVDDPELVTEMEWTGPNGNEIPSSDDNIKTMENYGGPGKLDLMIRNLREQDTGVYNCTATYAGNQKLTSGLLIESYMNIDFGDTPTHQTPFIGTESKIRCTPVAKPAPQVDWLKDLVPIKNDDNHIIQQDGVLIKEVTEADEGVYRCRARVPQLGSIDYKDIQVEVYIPPIINIVPEDAKGVEKDSVTFNCGATGKPVPVYSWVNKDNEPLEDKEGYYVDTEKGILTIMDLKPEHSGNYRCTATNPAGDDTADVNLLVLTKPKVEQYLNITEAVDADAEMRCIATGDPLPEIVFKKESEAEDFQNGINVDDRIEVEQTTDDQGRRVGIMKIRKVMRKDDGLYTCTANSEGGLTQVWGHITVEFKPTFEEQSRDEYWSWEQERVNLTCLATSIPNATIQWYFRNEEIKAIDNNLKVVALGPLGILEVNPSQSYYGTYTCQATNTLGTEEYNLELKEAHVPGPVSNVQLEKKTATTITWGIIDPIDNGGLMIQGYLVQYRIRDVSWDVAEEKFWTKGSSYTLDGLQPQETYVFRFSARNEAGNGEWGGEKVEEMPKRAAPEEPLIFNADSPVVEIPYKDHYVLQWKVPLDNGEPIDYFQIMYYQVHNSSGKWTSSGDKATEESKYPGTTSYTIENLRPETYYKIELRAHNMIGFSTPAEAIVKTAHDPSVKPGTGGPSKTYSSVAPSISAPAHGTVMPQPSTGGMGTGLIIGIIIILALIIIVVVDVICYCTKNAGLTATIVGKRGPKAKDKEAMLEEGKNASADTLNEESKDETKPLDEKPLPEKEVPKDLEKNDIISEKETDEKHEGNGQMKPTQEEETKPVVQQETPDEKVKETTEPTETTPMIQGRYVQQAKMPVQKHEPNTPSQSPMRLHGHSPHDLVNPMNDSRRSYSESHYLDNDQSGYGPDGYPLSMKLALENPVFTTNTFMRNSKSTSALDYDSDTSEDSTYAVPFQNEFPKRHSCLPVQSAPPPKPTKPKPPLPRRNTKTRLTSNRQALSHENLLMENGNRGIPSHYASQGSLLRPSTVYEDLKDSPNTPLQIRDNRSRIKYVLSSNEALDRLAEQTDDIRARRELLAQFQRPYKSPSESSNTTFYQPTDSPFYLKKPKVAFGVAAYDDPLIAQPQKPLGSFPGSKGVEPSSRKSSVSSNNEVLINGSTVPPSPYKSPSVSSNSTFYQPVDAPFYLKKPKVAFGVGAYDEPLAVPSPKAPHLPFSSNKMVNSPNTTASPVKSHHTPLPPKSQQPLPLPSNKMANSPDVIRPLPQKKTPIMKPRKPTVPPPPTPSKDKRKSMPIKTVTTMYFVERPQHPILSQSMDTLDEGHHPAPPVRESSPSYSPPSTISTARSLGSLLSSDTSQRSYNQPTLI